MHTPLFLYLRLIISVSTEPIFSKFLPYGIGIWSYINDLILFFPIAQGTLPWQPILEFKMCEIGRLTFIRRIGIPAWMGIFSVVQPSRL